MYAIRSVFFSLSFYPFPPLFFSSSIPTGAIQSIAPPKPNQQLELTLTKKRSPWRKAKHLVVVCRCMRGREHVLGQKLGRAVSVTFVPEPRVSIGLLPPKTRRKKKKEKRGRGGNAEERCHVSSSSPSFAFFLSFSSSLLHPPPTTPPNHSDSWFLDSLACFYFFYIFKFQPTNKTNTTNNNNNNNPSHHHYHYHHGTDSLLTWRLKEPKKPLARTAPTRTHTHTHTHTYRGRRMDIRSAPCPKGNQKEKRAPCRIASKAKPCWAWIFFHFYFPPLLREKKVGGGQYETNDRIYLYYIS